MYKLWIFYELPFSGVTARPIIKSTLRTITDNLTRHQTCPEITGCFYENQALTLVALVLPIAQVLLLFQHPHSFTRHIPRYRAYLSLAPGIQTVILTSDPWAYRKHQKWSDSHSTKSSPPLRLSSPLSGASPPTSKSPARRRPSGGVSAVPSHDGVVGTHVCFACVFRVLVAQSQNLLEWSCQDTTIGNFTVLCVYLCSSGCTLTDKKIELRTRVPPSPSRPLPSLRSRIISIAPSSSPRTRPTNPRALGGRFSSPTPLTTPTCV